jgi:hypothetical protein
LASQRSAAFAEPPDAGQEDLARYGSLDAVVAFIERRFGG